MPDWLGDLEGTLKGKARVGSTRRTVEEQDALADRGATRARGPNAPHVRTVDGHPGAADILGFAGSPGELQQSLVEAGFNVTRVRRESGKGPNQGTGAHDHVEFGPSGAGKAMATVDPNTGTPSGQSIVMAGGDPTNPFQASAPVKAAQGEIVNRAQAAQDALTQMTTELDGIQAQREADMRKTVDEKGAIYDQIREGTEEVHERTAPIFAQRAEIAKRRVDLTKMNPIVKDLLSIFNPNYSDSHLREKDGALADQAQLVSQEYDMNTKLAETMLNVITNKYSGEDAVTNLHAQNIEQDYKLIGENLTLARQQLNDALNGVQAGVTLTSAQVQARGVTLSQADDGQLNTMYSEASRNGGKTTVNGVQLSLAEIKDRMDNRAQQDMALKGQKLALANQEMALADNQESKLIEHMSATEIQSAIANGGMFKGVTLNQPKLTQALASSYQRQTVLAQSASQNVDQITYTKTIDAFNQVTQGNMARLKGITGSQPPKAFIGHVNRMVVLAQDYQARLAKTPDEAKPLVRAEFLKNLGSMTAQQDKLIDTTVQGMTRDPDAQILLGAWVKGNSPTPEQATKGVIALSRGGTLPPGVRLSGPAAAAFRAGQLALKGVDAKYDPNNPANRTAALRGQLGKPNAKALQLERENAVSQAVTNAWVNANVTDITNSAPQAAKAQGHAFGQVSPQDWHAAYAAGEQNGRIKFSSDSGIPVDKLNVSALTGEQRTQLATLQNAEMLRALDRSPSASHMRVKPSAALVDFYQSPGFQQGVSQWAKNVGQTGFGPLAADSIAGSGVGEGFNRYVKGLTTAQASITLADQAKVREQAASYAGTPYKRAAVILGSIPGLDPASEQALMVGLRNEVGVVNNTLAEIPLVGAGGDAISTRIDQIILHGKFEDPKLEKLRATAAKHWEVFSAASDRAVNRLTTTAEQ